MYNNIETGTFIMILLVSLSYSIISLIAQWKLFKKAGRHGWEVLIPFYNNWVFIKIAGLNFWYFIIPFISILLIDFNNIGALLLIICVNCYIMYKIYYNIAKRMKQNGTLYGILAITIPYLPILILGLSKNIVFDKTYINN